ncbi:protein-L-isoaspartate O-methyltransferase [Actinomadura sp. NBRC 104425]|uniref:methyltransferase domain-containing protein n=1 Tax=Actinomadura sp. NBRC 104425 TaxID=3032204 RepID=UPI0024A00F6B|nr:methyltransferase domain-containing protein [Actinomadura sp. NBRC 104425]GLZ12096.1 protein-L-isoaspartate O-methyltransferase [Actinomadura sp. NBRC 104425]
MSEAEALNQQLIDKLTDAGMLTDRWRPAFLAMPRHRFVPDLIWADTDDGGLTTRRREDDPAAWLETAYADEPIVTQVDDGATPDTGRGRLVTSSISKPSIVARMLAYLQVEPGMRVLEIGTGTGWNAALLAHTAGEQNVTTIEVDPVIADRARKTLAEAGITPTVVTGDGADGHAPGAPYDRIIATAAVQHIPYAWVEQTRPGGLILTPWGTAYDNGALVRLTVDEYGTAHGLFIDNTVAFMWLRAQRTPRPQPPTDLTGAAESSTTLHPDAVAWDDLDASFAVGLRLPEVARRFIDADDGTDDFTFWAFAGQSWACVQVAEGTTAHRVLQYGPRRLWEEIEAAYRWWKKVGQPSTLQFGLAVHPDRQYVYLDSPDNPV